MLPLYPVTAGVGGTALVPGSHTDEAQEGLRRTNKGWEKEGRDYCVLGDRGGEMRGRERLAEAQPGDLVLWDSRLVHAGRVGEGEGEVGPGELARASLCVCMAPREKAGAGVVEARREAVRTGGAMSHWPYEARSGVGQDRTGTYRPPRLSQLQRDLI